MLVVLHILHLDLPVVLGSMNPQLDPSKSLHYGFQLSIHVITVFLHVCRNIDISYMLFIHLCTHQVYTLPECQCR